MVMQPSAVFCVCVTSPLSAQCSTAVVQLHCDFGSLCVPNCEQQCLGFIAKNIMGQQHGVGGLRHTQMVCGVTCLV